MSGVQAVAAGVDTWSPCWYVDPTSPAARALDALAVAPTARGRMLAEPIDGHRIGWNAGAGMLYAEGHPSDDGLCSPGELPARLARLTSALRAADVPVPAGVSAELWESFRASPRTKAVHKLDGFAGVRRLDATVDLRCESTAQGVGVLAAVAAVARDAPRCKAAVYFANDASGVETVYFRGHAGKKVLGRWYDKGRESGDAPRGELIRPEAQERYIKGTRRGVEELTAGYVKQRLQRRFLPLWQASKGVTVSGPLVIGEKLHAAIEEGRIKPATAERLMGHVMLEACAKRGAQGVSKATRCRRKSKLRELGLVLSDDVLVEVEVRLDEVLEAALDGPAWGQG